MKRRLLTAVAGLFTLTMVTAGAMPALNAHSSCSGAGSPSSCAMASSADTPVASNRFV